MRFAGFIIIIVSYFFLFACCAGNKTKKEITTENNNPVGKKEDVAKRLVGIWLNAKGTSWIEFRENGTYEMGRGDSITKDNRMWAVDENTSLISLTTKKGVRYCEYHFDGDFLIIKMGKKEKNHRFHKIDAIPDIKSKE